MTSIRAFIVGSDGVECGDIALKLAVMGIISDCFSDSNAALASIEHGGYTFAVVSYEIPGGGLPLVAKIDHSNESRQVPIAVIMATSQDGPTLRIAAKKLNVRSVLQRPIGVVSLAKAVEGILTACVEGRPSRSSVA